MYITVQHIDSFPSLHIKTPPESTSTQPIHNYLLFKASLDFNTRAFFFSSSSSFHSNTSEVMNKFPPIFLQMVKWTHCSSRRILTFRVAAQLLLSNFYSSG